MDRRTLTKNWGCETVTKIKSYFAIAVLDKLFGVFYKSMICALILEKHANKSANIP